MFFGGGMPSQNVYTRRNGRWTRAQQQQQHRARHERDEVRAEGARHTRAVIVLAHNNDLVFCAQMYFAATISAAHTIVWKAERLTQRVFPRLVASRELKFAALFLFASCR